MATAARTARFVLDQNFPFQVLQVRWPLHVRLDPVAAVERHLVREHEEWEISAR